MVEIKKAKIKTKLFIEAEYTELLGNGVNNKVNFNSNNVVHADLKAAFDDLNETLAIMCEQYEKEKKEIGDVTFTGFVLGGIGDSAGVTLIGHRKLQNGKILNLISPFVTYDELDIRDEINTCIEEVYKYIFEGKHQPSDQMEFDFEENYEEEIPA